MDYGTPSKARFVASLVNQWDKPTGRSAYAVYRDGIFTVVFSVMPPNDII